MTRRQRSQRLAHAFKRYDAAREALRSAQLEVEAEFSVWAIGRSINRDEARRQLVSTGFLEEGKVKR